MNARQRRGARRQLPKPGTRIRVGGKNGFGAVVVVPSHRPKQGRIAVNLKNGLEAHVSAAGLLVLPEAPKSAAPLGFASFSLPGALAPGEFDRMLRGVPEIVVPPEDVIDGISELVE